MSSSNEGDGSMPAQRGSIHLVRLADVEARKRAFHALIATGESWVRLPGNVLGISTRQVEALQKEHVPFDWVSKAPSHA